MKPASPGAAFAAVLLSLAVNAGLFSFLPAMGHWRHNRGQGPEDKARETRLVPLPMLPKKKEKPKAEEAREKPAKRSTEPGKSLARQRFVMDLGMGGGSGGAAVSASEAGRPDLEQVAFEEGETDQDAQAIRVTRPRMPKEAEKAGARGTVKCLVTIGEDGGVVDVEFLEVPGNFGFEDAIRAAVREDRYKPAMAGGVPVRQRMEMTYEF